MGSSQKRDETLINIQFKIDSKIQRLVAQRGNINRSRSLSADEKMVRLALLTARIDELKNLQQELRSPYGIL